MNGKTPKTVLYLFGAGATHAEYVNLYPSVSTDASLLDSKGLLMEQVSKRVCSLAKDKDIFKEKKVRNLISRTGISNIELFIGLIEKNDTKSDDIVESLKQLIKRDICRRLTPTVRGRFYLHRSLFELHKKYREEKLLGAISLNYDRVLDDAYTTIFRKDPDYCLSSGASRQIPLLKLHGAFDLKYRGRVLPILAPGINKNYLALPYNFIWGRALELLIECDILRVIGCSLSQNDVGLVDLLFKAHLARRRPFLIELISFDPDGNPIKLHYGFLPRIETAIQIETGMISDQSIRDHTTGANPFKIWLKAKIQRALDDQVIERSRFVKMVLQ